MADLNIMPVFTDAYLADTTHLSREEHGSYLLLLMAMWRAGGRLKAETAFLMRVAKCTEKTWTKTWAVLEPLFTTEGEFITQKRLASEYSRAEVKVRQNKANASLGGKAKALNNKGRPLANANNSLEFRQSETAAESCPTVNRKPITESIPPVAPPNGGDPAQQAPKPARGKRSERVNGTRIAPDWKPSAEDRGYARGKGLSDQTIDAQAERFRNHWLASTARNAVKLDWPATWRNWVLSSIERNPSLITAHAGGGSDERARVFRMLDEHRRRGGEWPWPQEPREALDKALVAEWEAQNAGLFQSGGPH